MKKYVLDTSAVLAFIEDEEGAEVIENLIVGVIGGTNELYISAVTSVEVYYISIQEQGRETADERLSLIESLPLTEKPLNHELIKISGEIKASKAMSFADSCIAGLSKFMKAVLVHKDPEFEQVENEIEQLKLPYK
jgi:predicted nucleic acid-binding protein